MFHLKIVVIIAVLHLIVSIFVDGLPVEENLRIRILHNNDIHSRFEEVSRTSGICAKSDSEAGKCYGGCARIATIVRNARADEDKVPTLFFNAGDMYEGSHLYQVFKEKIVTKFMNLLAPDVACLGNHEFDNGVTGLLPFLKNAQFPLVAANLDWSFEPEMMNQTQLKKSHVLEVRGRKIGIIGYLTPSTATLGVTGKVRFLDEIESIRQEIASLKTQHGKDGINIFIALGHSGYAREQQIAREVEDLDLVIGGHSHTFLYGNDFVPDLEISEGDYPTVVVQPKTGRKVYVVQAYAFSKYMGNLTVHFDDDGEIVKIFGKPILLDSSIEQAKDVLKELEKWKSLFPNNMTDRVIGYSKVHLDGNFKVCRVGECNLGNLITDAMIDYRVGSYGNKLGWTDAPIAIMNSGNIRTSIPRKNNSQVTHNDLEAAYPYGDNLIMVDMDGRTLLKILEHSVHDSLTENVTAHGGAFLQVSGLKVVYDIFKPVYSRVASVRARCGLCEVPVYEDLKMNGQYRVLMDDYIFNGGDGFYMLPDLKKVYLNSTVLNVIEQYIKKFSPVYPEVQGRIKYKQRENSSHD